MKHEAIFCVFTKPPRPGSVKTRLEPLLGPEGAAALARAFLDDTWAFVRGHAPGRTVLAVAGDGRIDPLPGDRVEVWPQGEGDLGDRMERVLRRALREAPAAIAIGTDSPGLPPDRLEAARRALLKADAAIGPAEDGGFYLLGLRRCPEGLLQGLPWSRADTLQRTLERLKGEGFSIALLDPWFDVDRPEDLDRLAGLLDAGRITAPATARVAAPRLSVVVPVLNEERQIAAQLDSLGALPGLHEVLVVDGGSTDRTLERARGRSAVRFLQAPRGRAAQMNAGAEEAEGDVFLFLHADVRLPRNAVSLIRRALAPPPVVGGAFRTWTVADGGPRWWSPLLHLADLRSRWTSLPYGDQAIFVRKEIFRRVGGFPPKALMEDLGLARRLRREGPLATLPASVLVSGRRFQTRPCYYTLLMNALPLLDRIGVPAQALARLYGDPR